MRIIFLIILSFFAISCATQPKQYKFVYDEPIIITPKKPDKTGKLQPAEVDFNQLFDDANTLFDNGEFSGAEKLYADILKYNPAYYNSPYCYYNLGLIYLQKRDNANAEYNFKSAYLTLSKVQDKVDALNLYLQVLRKGEKWKEITDIVDDALANSFRGAVLAQQVLDEFFLRKAEAQVMAGALEEGRKTVNLIIYEMKKGKERSDLLYEPVLSMAYFVMGRSFVYEFSKALFENNQDSLLKKCTLILEAQKWFVLSIQTGVIYWTNASALETASLYHSLYSEMELFPIPAELNADEKAVYQCELWAKISGLLKKARKTLEKNIQTAKKISEQNEFIEKSYEMLIDINNTYDAKETFCTEKGLKNEKN